MKKYLHTYITLSLFLSFSSFAQFDGIPTGSGYYINKLIPSPSGNDLTNEYIEFRGGADEVVPNDLYLIVIEGDGESSSLSFSPFWTCCTMRRNSVISTPTYCPTWAMSPRSASILSVERSISACQPRPGFSPISPSQLGSSSRPR